MRPKCRGRWDFQFDSTSDGKAVKIAPMLDEHTGERLLNSWNAGYPPNGSPKSWNAASPRPAARRWCYAWTTGRK
jgi:hypothetical protein